MNSHCGWRAWVLKLLSVRTVISRKQAMYFVFIILDLPPEIHIPQAQCQGQSGNQNIRR